MDCWDSRRPSDRKVLVWPSVSGGWVFRWSLQSASYGFWPLRRGPVDWRLFGGQCVRAGRSVAKGPLLETLSVLLGKLIQVLLHQSIFWFLRGWGLCRFFEILSEKLSPKSGMSSRKDDRMMVDFSAPALPATINSVSKSFFFISLSGVFCGVVLLPIEWYGMRF